MTTSNDGQYAGWCTNWGAYDVPTLWKMLQGEDPARTSEHVSAWRMTYELLSTHMAELQSCRDDLAAKWSAANSPAAAAFLSYVDNMLASMKVTGEAAVSNYEGLAGINDALITAKAGIGELHDQWQKYQEEDNSFLSTVSFHLLSNTPDNWKQQLTLQAAKKMNTADTQIFQSRGQLTPAPTVNLNPGYIDQRDPFPASGSSNDNGTGGASAAHSGGGWAQPPFIPAPVPVTPPAPPTPPPAAAPNPAPGHGGLLAGGVAAPTELPPSPTPAPIPPTPPASGSMYPPVGVIGPRPGPFDGEFAMRRGSTGPESRTAANGRTAAVFESEPAASRGRASAGFGSEPMALRGRASLAPGGVIGGVEAAESRPTASAMRRINPVGGVIGEHSAGTVAATGGQSGGIAGQRGAKRRRDESDQHFDPDNPWVTEEGVPGVLMPQAEPTWHEAGPGVIGIDR